MNLEDPQYELLENLVEAHRSALPERRGSFAVSVTHNKPQASFIHSRVHGLSVEGSLSDAEVLAHLGLVKMSGFGSSESVAVLPAGIEAYEKRRRSLSDAMEVLSKDSKKLLESSTFRNDHGAAYEKWKRAADLLWTADSASELTTIGHLCREALQDFAGSLAAKHGVDVSELQAPSTVKRLKLVVSSSDSIGKTRRSLLDKLIAYWRSVSDLVQRQEHGASREGEELSWEDGRCVVFETCFVMYEVSRALP